MESVTLHKEVGYLYCWSVKFVSGINEYQGTTYSNKKQHNTFDNCVWVFSYLHHYNLMFSSSSPTL